MMAAHDRAGSAALVYYRGGVVGEDPLDDHSSGEPERIVLGVGEVPKGMDDALLNMEVGEERTIRIPCELGFGEHDPAGVQVYPRTFVENGGRLKEGDVLSWVNPVSGQPIPVAVVRADQNTVTVDFNHPFAGKELEYWLHLVEVA